MKVDNIDKGIISLEQIIVEMEYLVPFKGRSIDSLSSDEIRSIPRAFEIIGEASRRLSIEFTQKYDQVKWNKLIGLRNIIAHQYDKFDMKVLFVAINEQIETDLLLIKAILEDIS